MQPYRAVAFKLWFVSALARELIENTDAVTEPNLGPLTHHAAKPIYWHWVVVKYSIYCRHQARRTGSSCSKDPNSLMAFREGFLKATFGVRAAGCMTVFWLVGSEVTGWCFRSLNHQPSGSNQSGVCVLAPSSTGRGLSFCRTTQRYVLDCYVYSLRRN